ncbi:MAG: hypothetical protein ACYSYV_05310 [Planctomycetota bacterium]
MEVLARGPDFEAISVPPDYATRAIEAAGGFNAWTKTKELQLDCVVTCYQPDGSFYLTEQRYNVYPWSNAIQISAREPRGSFVWQLSKGQFDVLEGGAQIDELPIAAPSRCFAEVILNIITAPVRFLDESVEFAQQGSSVKIQGQWYYPINRRAKPDVETAERLAEAVFYQDRDNSLVDTILFACVDAEKLLRVRGYDYDEIEKGGLLVPTRIEIFSTDARGNLQRRLVKIDCRISGHAK